MYVLEFDMSILSTMKMRTGHRMSSRVMQAAGPPRRVRRLFAARLLHLNSPDNLFFRKDHRNSRGIVAIHCLI